MDGAVSRRQVSSGGPWEERIGYSRAIRTGDRVWVSGTTGTAHDGSVPDGALVQSRLALDIIEDALVESDASAGDVVMVRIYLVDFGDMEDIAIALRERFGEVRPAMTAVR